MRSLVVGMSFAKTFRLLSRCRAVRGDLWTGSRHDAKVFILFDERLDIVGTIPTFQVEATVAYVKRRFKLFWFEAPPPSPAFMEFHREGMPLTRKIKRAHAMG